MKNKIRILVADDHMLLRMGLISFISGKADLECVGEADNGRTAVSLARQLKPDVIIMDLMMPEMSGSEAIRIIHKESPETRIIVLTSYGTSKEMSDAIAGGACAALLKDTSTADLVDAIRRVATGESIIPQSLIDLTAENASQPNLTDHQMKILGSIAIGRSNADIAKEFGISENTVKKIASTIFAKLGATSRSEATSIAIRKQLLKI